MNSNMYFTKLSKIINQLDLREIDEAIGLIENKWKAGNQIITLGNGGSAMTALHFITDWNKMIYLKTGIRFRGRTLVDNMGLIMAYGNDMKFENIFVEQLKNILAPDDLVISISGSGNSENVLRAVEYANLSGAVTLGLCGFDGGRLMKISQYHLWVNSNDMQIVEDIHSIFGHIVTQKLCGY